MTIWLASGNVHKQRELAALLRGHRIRVPTEGGIDVFDPEETGKSFVENALIKAKALYALLAERRMPGKGGREIDPVIADDSGLCVDALGGRPGIYSARYGADGGKKLETAERNALLLEELNNALGRGRLPAPPQSKLRSCRFVCAMVLLFSPDRFYAVQETLEGEIVPAPAASRGSGGFGYDPIVYLPEQGKTVAELSEEEKNRLSHRGKAGRIIAELLNKQITGA
jgi:XTP/dITP diphosphohydrolase